MLWLPFYNAIDNNQIEKILTSCFLITKSNLSFHEIIVYEKLRHVFRRFASPSPLFKFIEQKALSGNPYLKLAFARTIKIAFDVPPANFQTFTKNALKITH